MYVHPFKFTTSCIFKTFLFSYLISFLATFHSLINWKLNIYSNFYWHNRQTDKQRKTNQYPLFLHEDPGDQQALEDIYIFFAFFLSVSFSFSFLWRKIKVTLISHIYTRGPLSSVRFIQKVPDPRVLFINYARSNFHLHFSYILQFFLSIFKLCYSNENDDELGFQIYFKMCISFFNKICISFDYLLLLKKKNSRFSMPRFSRILLNSSVTWTVRLNDTKELGERWNWNKYLHSTKE